ncbi:type II toxin-antitoxin system death-on-curing family toxin [Micromonospora cathayae]|uniref:Type II toxin-antitoxin system death-on-curing family toxin n=1 Tax=Micromonospora cathayae TaxID=3028804 RepID=A0ABY7ZR98_9ACTN|nr:type II toxin-antitoxin system death-on-curing family toxin [Micromonospora sp. HUAS 3]WDZ85502.1 type II toxin-antitoxin system death-on-curing family toxin [Micromonospora sp. HUAS 3]
MSRDLYYPTLADVARLADKLGLRIRDAGLIESALARPQTSVFGQAAYPDTWTKSAALLHSLVGNHPFLDGNKRMGWIVAVAFLRRNGAVTPSQLTGADQDAAYDLVIGVAEGRITEVDQIGDLLRKVF